MIASPNQTRPPAVDRVLELANEYEAAGRHEKAKLLRTLALTTDLGVDGSEERLVAARGSLATSPSRGMVGRLHRRYSRRAIEELAQRPRIWKYRALSTCRRVSGSPKVLQPVLFIGPGEVVLGEDVQFGWKASPLFYTGYCHVEASSEQARIEIGDRTEFNNNLLIKSEGAGIYVGRDGLFGAHVEIFDSDFHDLHPARRKTGVQKVARVDIGDNVFVGMGVRVLKGATIGPDSVIGAGSVVTGFIPAGVIAAGNPARVIREL